MKKRVFIFLFSLCAIATTRDGAPNIGVFAMSRPGCRLVLADEK